jgi:hypothetical protein
LATARNSFSHAVVLLDWCLVHKVLSRADL